VNSCSGSTGERRGGSLDQVDHDRVRGLLALIAGTVSYLHMHDLVARHGQPGWVAALTPLSEDGMIVAASTTLLADSRSGRRGGVLPWALLVARSVASLAANVAVAEPTLIGRVIPTWPSFALTASFELLTRQVRRSAPCEDAGSAVAPSPRRISPAATHPTTPRLRVVSPPKTDQDRKRSASDLQWQAWQWRWTTAARTALSQAVTRSHVPMTAKNAGAGLSRARAWQGSSARTRLKD
jgi:hypothetical protein